MSDSHLYNALYWKLLWSYKRKIILLSLITIAAVLITNLQFIALIFTGSSKAVDEHVTFPRTPEQIFMSLNQKTEIKYAPENMETSTIMREVNQKLKNCSLKSLRSAEEVENEFIKEKSKKRNMTENFFSYGVIFEHVSKNELKYSLRSTVSKGWNTQLKIFNGSEHYFCRNFIPLQIAINSGYLKYLGAAEKNWSLQEFPNPKYTQRVRLFSSDVLCILIVYGLSPIFYCTIKFIMDEKSSGAKDIMILHGFKLKFVYLYWTIYFLIPFLIVITIMSISAIIVEATYYTSAFFFWLLLLIFVVSSMALIFFLASVFTNNTFAMLFYFIPLAGIVHLKHFASFKTMSFMGILTALTPGGSLVQGTGLIQCHEAAGFSIKLENMIFNNKSCTEGPYLVIILAPLVSTIIMILLSVYLNLVRPGQYRRARPWYFIFPNCLTSRLRSKNSIPNRSIGLTPVIENIELEGEIRVRNLHKVFKKFIALNDLSLDFYKGQITSLLGHNGAGKTTFLFTLTGIIAPTYGEIIYQDYDVLLNFNKFRESFGFCPQQNIVIEDLTVKQQILFFGMVKKMSMAEAQSKAESLLNKFNISDRQNALAEQLSGGQQRKLCLAIAVVNNPPVVFLDEPSSGLDTESRRNLWDIVLNLRKDRTIIITTHFMEEADVLGDRIAIIAHGELRCYGSPMFLKKYYGFGHSISITYKNEPQEISSIVNSYVKATMVIDNNKKQITFNVAMEETPKLPGLFTALDSIIDKTQLSVSCTSMENVFLKVQEGEGITTEFDQSDIDFVVEKHKKNTGATKFFQQLAALLHKRALHMKNQWILYVGLLYLAPTVILVISMLISNSNEKQKLETPELLYLDLDFYGETDVIISGSEQNISKSFQNLIEKQGSSAVITNSASKELMSSVTSFNFEERCIVAGDFLNKSAILFYSSTATHSAPIATNLYFNSYLQSENIKASISVINYPFTFISECEQSKSYDESYWSTIVTMILYSTCVFNFFPMREKEVGIKHLQYMAELKPMTYWISNIIFDVALCAVSMLLLIFIIYVMDIYQIYTDADLLFAIFLMFFMFSLYIMLLGYLFSIIITGYDIASSVIFFGVILFYYGSLILIYVFGNLKKYVVWFNLITPIISMLEVLEAIDSTSTFRELCKKCSNLDEDFCKSIDESFILQRKFLTGMIWLIAHGTFALLLTLLLDYKFLEYIKYFYTRRWYKEHRQEFDDDVEREKETVKKYLSGESWKKPEDENTEFTKQDSKISQENKGSTNRYLFHVMVDQNSPFQSQKTSTDTSISDKFETSPVMVVDGLTKMYAKSFVAADQVTFSVTKGQCFGLLGVSGAGKSTVFCMLSGRIYPTKGTAYIFDDDKQYKLKIGGFDFIHKMGYCPQEYWIHGYLTARQLITHFAHLRGIRKNEVKDVVSRWIKILDLHNYCDKPCGTYSGGNKRKLSTALALVGAPIIILLDEPTTGVDPVARRKLCMDECEAICNNLAIMAKGKVQCIGEINYLKNKFAQGCTVFIKFETSAPSEVAEKIKNAMTSTFGNCELTDQQLGFLHFRINEKHVSWSETFSKMEQIKKKLSEIEEYMLSDTTLEQIFLSFTDK